MNQVVLPDEVRVACWPCDCCALLEAFPKLSNEGRGVGIVLERASGRRVDVGIRHGLINTNLNLLIELACSSSQYFLDTLSERLGCRSTISKTHRLHSSNRALHLNSQVIDRISQN